LKNPPVVEKIAVRYQDLDPYGHVNNVAHMTYFESARIAYFRTLAERLGLGPLEAGDIPGVRYVVVEATVRYRTRIYLEDVLFCGVSVRSVSGRSFVWDYELRAGEDFETGRLAAEGSSAQVFFDPEAGEALPRPEWFLTAVAELEDRPETSFAPTPEEGG
jgi:acyl-CoA thioester hydrolase